MEAVQKTPEREAFYKKIDGENLSALWNVMGDLITPQQGLTITFFQGGEATTRPERFAHITNGPLHPAFLIAGAHLAGLGMAKQYWPERLKSCLNGSAR